MWNTIESILKNSRFGIRLELRPLDRNLAEYDYIQAENPNYFPTVINAASLAFESIFHKDEPMAMLCRKWVDKRTGIRKTTFGLRQVQFDTNTNIRFRKRKTRGRGCWVSEALVCGRRENFNHHNLFLGIAHRDFQVQPIVREQVLFVSLKQNLVYFMYDDRGVMIATPSRETLPNLSASLNILRYEDVDQGDFLA